MTLAEIVFLVAGGIGIYLLLRPLQRWLESRLRSRLLPRHPRRHRTTIDVTDFTSEPSQKEEDHEPRV